MSDRWREAVAAFRTRAATWIDDAECAELGAVLARREDRSWVALWTLFVTKEDGVDRMQDDGRWQAGDKDLVVGRVHIPKKDINDALDALASGHVPLGWPDDPIELPGEPTPDRANAWPLADEHVLPEKWPHFGLRGNGQPPRDVAGAERFDRWVKMLPVHLVSGFAGLATKAGLHYQAGLDSQTFVQLLVPRHLRVSHARREGDDLHVALQVPQPKRHPNARVLVFDTAVTDPIASHSVSGLWSRKKEMLSGWTVSLPKVVGELRLVLTEGSFPLDDRPIRAPLPLPGEGSVLSESNWGHSSHEERIAAISAELWLLRKTEMRDRGARFERVVDRLLDLVGLPPRGSISFGRKQIDNAFTLDGRVVLAEATARKGKDLRRYVEGDVRSRLDRTPPDTRCVVFVVAEPPQAALEAARSLRRVAYVTAEEVSLVLTGVITLGNLIRMRLRGLDLGQPFHTLIERIPRKGQSGRGGMPDEDDGDDDDESPKVAKRKPRTPSRHRAQ